MLTKCKCGREFLSEADPYIVIPWPDKEMEFRCTKCFKQQTVQEIIIWLEDIKKLGNATTKEAMHYELDAVINMAKKKYLEDEE